MIFERVRSNDELGSAQRDRAFLVRFQLEANGVQGYFQFRQRSNEHCIHRFDDVVVGEPILDHLPFLQRQRELAENKQSGSEVANISQQQVAHVAFVVNRMGRSGLTFVEVVPNPVVQTGGLGVVFGLVHEDVLKC